jgi:hypothetical protein
MKGETQALHLSQMMQNYIHTTKYELALPLVTVRSTKLKKLSVKDVLLLDLKVLEFVLIERDTICADLVLKNLDGTYVTEIIQLHKKTISSNDSNKYETVKFSFGACQMKSLEVGNNLDMAQFDLEKITLMLGDKKVAEGSLVNSDNEVAVKINKVIQ